MERYKLEEQLGDGTYGCVVKGRNKETGKVVAIKRMKRKFNDWNECVTLREIESLRTLSSHPHIVQMQEVIRESDSALYFVFEFMPDGNLYELIKRCTPRKNLSSSSKGDGRSTSKPAQTLSRMKIRSIISQVLSGLEHMHSRGYFHRDIKPENLLLRGDVCKVADFGLAREIRSRPPYTDYVSTRWYRAPEILLRSPRYGTPIDAFAVGCVMAELVSLRPLFPGRSEPDQISRLVTVLGSPTETTWPEGMRLASHMGLHFPDVVAEGCAAAQEVRRRDARRREKSGGGQEGNVVQSIVVHTPLEKVVPRATPEALQLMRDLLKWDPKARPSSAKSLRYPYFTGGNQPERTRVEDDRQQQKERKKSEPLTQHAETRRTDVPSGVKRKSPDDGNAPAAKLSGSEKKKQAGCNYGSDMFGRSQFDREVKAGRLQHEVHGGSTAEPFAASANFGMPQFLQPAASNAAPKSLHSTSAPAGNHFGAPQFSTVAGPVFDPANLVAETKTPGLMPEASLAAFAAPGGGERVTRNHVGEDFTFPGVESTQLNANKSGRGFDECLANAQHHGIEFPFMAGTNRDNIEFQSNPFNSVSTGTDEPHHLTDSSFDRTSHQSAHLPSGAYDGGSGPSRSFEASRRNDHPSHAHKGRSGGAPFARAGLRAMRTAAFPADNGACEPRSNNGTSLFYNSGSPMSLYVGGGLNSTAARHYPPSGISPGKRLPRHGRAMMGGGGVLNPYKSPKGASSAEAGTRGLAGSSSRRAPSSGFDSFNFP